MEKDILLEMIRQIRSDIKELEGKVDKLARVNIAGSVLGNFFYKVGSTAAIVLAILKYFEGG